MIVLILTRAGFDDIQPTIRVGRDAVWANAGILTESEVAAFRSSGWDLTVFAYPLNPADVASDIDTVRLHHPHQVVWVEAGAEISE